MNLSEEKLLIILVASLAAVSLYMFIRRTFWPNEEIKEAIESYSEEVEGPIKQDDIEETTKYIKNTKYIYGIFSLASWLILIYLLDKYY